MPSINCAECGAAVHFEGNRRNRKYCPDCVKVRKRKQQTESERRRREKLGEEYRRYERERYQNNPKVKAQKLAGARHSYVRQKAVEETYQELLARQAAYQAAYRDRVLYGGNRQAVFERDEGKCQTCGTTENLAIHHKDGLGYTTPKDDKNNDIDNLVLICGACHRRLHVDLDRALGYI